MVQVCKVNDDYNYAYCQVTHKLPKDDNSDGYVLRQIKVDKDGPMTFSIAQKDKRCFSRKNRYSYSYCRLILMKLAEDSG